MVPSRLWPSASFCCYASDCRLFRASDGGDGGGKVTITFWHSCVSSTVPALNELIANFEEEHPGIEVKAQYVPTGDALIQKLITSVQSKTAPDISWIHANFLQAIIEAEPSTRWTSSSHGPDSLSAPSWTIFTRRSWRKRNGGAPLQPSHGSDGHRASVSTGTFPQRGAGSRRTGPTTGKSSARCQEAHDRQEMATARTTSRVLCSRFPASGPLGDWMVWQLYPFLFQAGGTNINTEQTQVLYNSQAGVQALTLWKRHLQGSNSPRSPSTTKSRLLPRRSRWRWTVPGIFRAGKSPGESGLGGCADARRSGEAGNDRRGGVSRDLQAQSEHPQAAWTFVKWMVRPDVQAIWSMKSRISPGPACRALDQRVPRLPGKEPGAQSIRRPDGGRPGSESYRLPGVEDQPAHRRGHRAGHAGRAGSQDRPGRSGREIERAAQVSSQGGHSETAHDIRRRDARP